MKSLIIRYILSLFNDEATRKIAGQVGEDHSKVQHALENIIPVIMRGFASKSAEGPDQVNHLLNLATSATSSSWFQTAANWFTGSDLLSKGEEILNDLFGNKNVDRIAGQVATQNNIKPAAAYTLMQWAAPLCLGALGKHIRESKLDAGNLAAWLSKEKMDFDAPSTAAGTAAGAATSYASSHSQPQSQKSNSKLLVPILLLLAAAALIWFLMKGCNNEQATATSPNADTTIATHDTTTIATPEMPTVSLPTFTLNADSTLSYIYGDTVTETLPDGTTLRIPNNGAEFLLISKIKEARAKGLDTSDEGKKAGWINLYDVQFSKMLTYHAGATEQISNISKILKAYPAVHIKLGGYTDNTGSDEVNQKLSQQRAEQVSAALGKTGVAAQVDKAEGYGSQFPVADNSIPEGRAQNRRVSCRIVSIQP